MESPEIVSIRSSAYSGFPTFWNWILVYENFCLRVVQGDQSHAEMHTFVSCLRVCVL